MFSLLQLKGLASVRGSGAGIAVRRLVGFAVAACMAVTLTGCSFLRSLESVPEPEPKPEIPQPAPPREPAPIPTPKSPSQREVGPRSPHSEPVRVAIVYSDEVPVYRAIADELAARLPAGSSRVPLARGDVRLTSAVVTDHQQVVAIGAVAARQALEFSAKPLVFCQVFNYRDYGLATKGVIGISMVPPTAKQFRTWRSLAPDLDRIAVISGPGHDGLIAVARKDAQAQGAELMYRQVHSDKEALYEFKRMVPDADGFWLLPDERILSHGVLREIMSYSAKHGRLVLSFTPELLRFGALMSASSDPADVANQVVLALQHLSDAAEDEPFRLLPLNDARIEINHDLARRLGADSSRRPDSRGRQDAR